jgi:Co/Zn/Cd efflux system component
VSDDEPEFDARDAKQRRILRAALGINLAQAAVVSTIGWYAQSTGLLGVGLDNLADAGVYAVSLYAVGRTAGAKVLAARLSGGFLLLIAGLLLVEIVRRFLYGADPIGPIMIVTALANAATNLVVMRLLRSQREEGVHMKASWIFTGNDMIANAGIVLSGILVMLLHNPIPDLIIGLIVVLIGAKGGWEIIEQARKATRGEGSEAADT